MMTSDFYDNIIDQLGKNNPNKNVKSWFTRHKDDVVGEYYGCNVVNSDFDNWIKGEMKDE